MYEIYLTNKVVIRTPLFTDKQSHIVIQGEGAEVYHCLDASIQKIVNKFEQILISNDVIVHWHKVEMICKIPEPEPKPEPINYGELWEYWLNQTIEPKHIRVYPNNKLSAYGEVILKCQDLQHCESVIEAYKHYYNLRKK